MTSAQTARIKKTRHFFENRDAFMHQLVEEISAGIRYAEQRNFIPAFRLNGLSDIPWHRIATALGMSVMELFCAAQFYDYTKVAKRILSEELPPNYHLTFSYDGTAANVENARRVLAMGGNVAVVFRNEATRDHYAANGGFLNHPVINGDESDVRFYDPKGVVVGLYAKGPAKKDRSGFVVD
jgi:hypothetical protein